MRSIRVMDRDRSNLVEGSATVGKMLRKHDVVLAGEGEYPEGTDPVLYNLVHVLLPRECVGE